MTQAQPGQQNEKSQQPKNTKRVIAIVLTSVLLLLLFAAGAWFAWQLALCDQKVSELTTQKTQLETKVDELEKALAAAKESAATPSTDSPAVCNDTPSESRKENIRAALDSKNTAAFSTYVTNPVQYVLAASEYGGNVSPDEAALSLEYTHSATGPWDFNLPQATLDAYAVGGYAMYFDANTYVGRAASGMVVAFDFDCDGKISEIFVVADDSLL